MDYIFEIDTDGHLKAEFSMGHEAFGRWFAEELGDNVLKIDHLLNQIQQLEQSECQEVLERGRDFDLKLSRDQVDITAKEIDPETVMPDDAALYEQESHAECGLEDFKAALESWREYVV